MYHQGEALHNPGPFPLPAPAFPNCAGPSLCRIVVSTNGTLADLQSFPALSHGCGIVASRRRKGRPDDSLVRFQSATFPKRAWVAECRRLLPRLGPAPARKAASRSHLCQAHGFSLLTSSARGPAAAGTRTPSTGLPGPPAPSSPLSHRSRSADSGSDSSSCDCAP